MDTGKAAAQEPARQITIRDLISYQVSRAAGLMSRGAALAYRRHFRVSLGEWRAIALLAATPGLSLMQLARHAGLDKAQMSRVVTSLIDRQLVIRTPSAAGGRVVELNLSQAGMSLYYELIDAARRRDDEFRAGLTEKEMAILEKALNVLSRTARAMAEREGTDTES